MILNLNDYKPNEIYHIMTQTLIPRPVAWVLSENPNQSYNLAPFSYFTAISSDPPIIMFSVGKKPDGSFKDTRVNIEERTNFTLHIASVNLANEVTQTSKGLGYGESELDLVDLKLMGFNDFPLPRIQECPVAYGCTLFEIQEMGNVPQSLIFGEIQTVYISDDISKLEGSRIVVDAQQLNPLSRLGGSEYSSITNVFSIPRPK